MIDRLLLDTAGVVTGSVASVGSWAAIVAIDQPFTEEVYPFIGALGFTGATALAAFKWIGDWKAQATIREDLQEELESLRRENRQLRETLMGKIGVHPHPEAEPEAD